MATTLDEIRTEVLETAGLASDDSRFPDATLTRVVNRALRALSAEADWPWNQDTETIDLLVGDATFDYTGGASEDLWTLSSHGLSVGDRVQFTATGTGADEYSTGTDYWVVTVADANTFQLSTTRGGSVLAGTADSVGTWTLRKLTHTPHATWQKTLRLRYNNRDLQEYQSREAAQWATDTGRPAGFFIELDQINIVPTPDGVYTIEHVFSSVEDALSADGDTPNLPDRYIDWLVAICLVQVATRIRDMDLYSLADRERRRWSTLAADEQRRSTGTGKIKARRDWNI